MIEPDGRKVAPIRPGVGRPFTIRVVLALNLFRP
jgi:hypothetical protein